MPELPEVQTIVSDLNRKLKGHSITKIWTDWPKSFFSAFPLVKKNIIGRQIIRVRRRAKNILIDFKGGKTLLIHLKMTGHLLYRDKNWKSKAKKDHPFHDSYNQYIRTVFHLNRSKELAFSDLRRFGEIVLLDSDKENELKRLKELGPEPLDKKFNYCRFKKRLNGKTGQIKSALLDQSFIAGIGNIYADEILWESKIHPKAKISRLSDKQKKNLFQAIKKILQLAVKHRGTSMSDYRDAEGKKGGYQNIIRVYQRKGERCYRCYTPIKKTKVNNRGTNYCPHCQKEK